MTTIRQRLLCCGLLAVALVLGGCGQSSDATSTEQASTTLALPNFTQLVDDNKASVVNISTTQKVQVGSAAVGDLLNRLFGDQLGDRLQRQFGQPQHPQETHSLGSGFILSKDGYILTNYHVVKGADSIRVRLNDRRELPAKVIGQDEPSDLALLKVDADNLVPVKIGSSHDLKVGQWVLAIGAPFGFDSTVTAGIVSAKSRSLPNDNYVPFIQTDVPINPGNSGGPLFNLNGEVVGINSQIVSKSGGFMGLSFAIPIDLAMQVVKQLKAGKQVQRGWLGVMIQNVTHDLAKSFGLNRPHGALVARVSPDSPAAKAGIKAGDVIVKFNGVPVDTSGELPPIVGLLSPGSRADVEVVRHGKHKSLTVTIGTLPQQSSVPNSQEAPDSHRSSLGLVVAPLDAADKAADGVKVVSASGAAAAAGIRVGDIIESINNTSVTDPASFRRLLKRYKSSQSLALLISHQGNAAFVVVHKDEN